MSFISTDQFLPSRSRQKRLFDFVLIQRIPRQSRLRYLPTSAACNPSVFGLPVELVEDTLGLRDQAQAFLFVDAGMGETSGQDRRRFF